MNYEENIGKRVHKGWSGKAFKSGLKINTVKGVINHPILNIPAYTFEEDDSYVECRRCEPYIATHEVLDLVYHEDEGNVVFQGSEEECLDWIQKQGGATFTYKISPIIEKII